MKEGPSEHQHDRPVTDEQVAAASLSTRTDNGRAVFVLPEVVAAYNRYLREHAWEMNLLLRVRRDYMGDA